MSIQVNETPATETAVLTLTTGAANRIKGLITEKGLSAEHGLRVFISGGGCSGMQYGMAFDANPQASDRVIEADGVKLIVDPMSLPYLLGANIDFVDSVMGGGFRIDNPNAVSTCACGRGDSEAESGACGCHS